MRHDGCGGRAGKGELLTGIEGASSRTVRRILLIGGCAVTTKSVWPLPQFDATA